MKDKDNNRKLINITYLERETTLMQELTHGISYIDSLFSEYNLPIFFGECNFPFISQLSDIAKKELVEYMEIGLITAYLIQYYDTEEDKFLLEVTLYNYNVDFLHSFENDDLIENNTKIYRSEISKELCKELQNLFISKRLEFMFQTFNMEEESKEENENE